MTNTSGIRLLGLALVVCLLAPAGTAAAKDDDRPNFVVIFVDDLGYNDVGSFGSPYVNTPNIDRLAGQGTKLTSFYAQAVCGPSRAALLTGSYPIRVGEVDNKKHQHTVPHPEEITLAEQLKTAGYRTGCIGKWHLAGNGGGKHGRGTGPYNPKLMPNAQGFDYFYGTPKHNGFKRQDPDGFKVQVNRNRNVVTYNQDVNKLTGNQTEEAIKFIRRNRDQPFFCYLAYSMVHVVLGASDRFRGRSDRGLYGDALLEIDHGVGRIMKTLKELGLDRDTMIVFTSDNGPWVESHLRDHGGSAHPLRGMKMNTWEGGLRVPGIVRWPGKVPSGRVTDGISTTLDLFATFSSLAGAEMPDDRTLDSIDMTDYWLGRRDSSPRNTFYYYAYTHLQAVRHGKWKLVRPRPSKPRWTGWSGRMIDGVDKPQLYNLEKDVAELNDVAGQHPDVVERLQQLITSGRRELGDYNLVGAGARFFEPDPPATGDRRKHRSGSDRGNVATRLSTGRGTVSFTYETALEHESGVTRRDPSDVIRHGGKYYVWYTRGSNASDTRRYPSGYGGNVYYATSEDGHRFTEQGPAIGHGKENAWDGHGVFTPNILRWKDRFYLYYTGVARPFDRDSPTAIGVAVADSPEGPWKKIEGNPILEPKVNEPAAFDSKRVGDAALMVREGRVWLYYNGRSAAHGDSRAARTRLGAATAPAPPGDYRRSPHNPLLRDHDVLVWQQSYGVGSMTTAGKGPGQLYYAFDGVQFTPRNRIKQPPRAPGLFRPGGFTNHAISEIPQWGVSMRRKEGDFYLVRFNMQY